MKSKSTKEVKKRRYQIREHLKEHGPQRLCQLEETLVGDSTQPFRSKQNLLYHLGKMIGEGRIEQHKPPGKRFRRYYLPGQELSREQVGADIVFQNPGRIIEHIHESVYQYTTTRIVDHDSEILNTNRLIFNAKAIKKIIEYNIERLPDFPPDLDPRTYFSEERAKVWRNDKSALVSDMIAWLVNVADWLEGYAKRG